MRVDRLARSETSITHPRPSVYAIEQAQIEDNDTARALLKALGQVFSDDGQGLRQAVHDQVNSPRRSCQRCSP